MRAGVANAVVGVAATLSTHHRKHLVIAFDLKELCHLLHAACQVLLQVLKRDPEHVISVAHIPPRQKVVPNLPSLRRPWQAQRQQEETASVRSDARAALRPGQSEAYRQRSRP
jgi:hypothetical protein